ncbi:uncharacterized protein LOC114324301 [Diabrotica virgifera virgifera]|uniref:Uncharacterized protein LOC114324301 n=1 Tax=Diabrotica virgifera virgifera TaxID=50390 RepID=A0A6P7EXM2_DIAVI|nr:uncharacterized protein LOC114324301 [Diabrotica virgifera virgifera]
MKVLIVCFALVFGLTNANVISEYENENVALQGIFEDILNGTINGILGKMTEPLVMNDTNLVFKEEGTLEGVANISNFKLSGLKSLVATYIKITGASKLNMTVKLPSVSVNFKYNLDVLLLDLIPLYGKGVNNIEIDTISLNITGGINLSNGIKVNGIGVLLDLGTAVFNLNGLLNNPEFSALVNTALNDNFCDFVDKNAELLSKILGQIFEQIINNAL